MVSSAGLVLSFAWTCLSCALECKSGADTVGATYSAPAYAGIWAPGLVDGSYIYGCDQPDFVVKVNHRALTFAARCHAD